MSHVIKIRNTRARSTNQGEQIGAELTAWCQQLQGHSGCCTLSIIAAQPLLWRLSVSAQHAPLASTLIACKASPLLLPLAHRHALVTTWRIEAQPHAEKTPVIL